jgi:hypothetical protein
MKIERHYVILGILSLALAGIAALLLSCADTAQAPEIAQFNARPDDFGSGLYNNIDKIPAKKLGRLYKTKIVVHGSYSPEKHLVNHPQDIAVRTGISGEDVIIILTNEDPAKSGYFVKVK